MTFHATGTDILRAIAARLACVLVCPSPFLLPSHGAAAARLLGGKRARRSFCAHPERKAKVLPGDVPGGNACSCFPTATTGRPVLLSPGGLLAFDLDDSVYPGGNGGPGDGLALFALLLLALFLFALFTGCSSRF